MRAGRVGRGRRRPPCRGGAGARARGALVRRAAAAPRAGGASGRGASRAAAARARRGAHRHRRPRGGGDLRRGGRRQRRSARATRALEARGFWWGARADRGGSPTSRRSMPLIEALPPAAADLRLRAEAVRLAVAGRSAAAMARGDRARGADRAPRRGRAAASRRACARGALAHARRESPPPRACPTRYARRRPPRPTRPARDAADPVVSVHHERSAGGRAPRGRDRERAVDAERRPRARLADVVRAHDALARAAAARRGQPGARPRPRRGWPSRRARAATDG